MSHLCQKSEESPDVTITQLQNKLKHFEAGRATAKYIKSGDAKEVHQIKRTKKHKNQGANKAPSLKMTLAKIAKVKRTITGNNHYKQPSSETAMPAPKKQFHGHGQQTKKIDPSTCMRCGDTRHRPGFSCPAAKYTCKACSKVGHFTSRCLTKPKTVNQITQEEESAYLNAWQDDSSYFICQIQGQKTITKRLYANLPLVQQCHHRCCTYLRVRIDPGADVNVMPAAVYKQLTGDTGLKSLGPVQCTMRVYTTQAITNLGSLQVFIKYPGRKPEPITFNITNQEGSVLLSCEDSKLNLITPQPGLEHMVEGSKLIASQADINQVSHKPNEQELSQELETPKTITCKEDIQKYFPDVIDGLGTFQENLTILTSMPIYLQNDYQQGQSPSTSRQNLNTSYRKCWMQE